ncbi:MAG: hypothetical protein ACI8PP_002300 [Candidatus Pseudothioglobus sp.]|jgi:hypothetical protein
MPIHIIKSRVRQLQARPGDKAMLVPFWRYRIGLSAAGVSV